MGKKVTRNARSAVNLAMDEAGEDKKRWCWFPFQQMYGRKRIKPSGRSDDAYPDPPNVYYIRRRGANGKLEQCEVALFEYDETASQHQGATELVLEGHPMPVDRSRYYREFAYDDSSIVEAPPLPSPPRSRRRNGDEHLEIIRGLNTNCMTKEFWVDEMVEPGPCACVDQPIPHQAGPFRRENSTAGESRTTTSSSRTGSAESDVTPLVRITEGCHYGYGCTDKSDLNVTPFNRALCTADIPFHDDESSQPSQPSLSSLSTSKAGTKEKVNTKEGNDNTADPTTSFNQSTRGSTRVTSSTKDTPETENNLASKSGGMSAQRNSSQGRRNVEPSSGEDEPRFYIEVQATAAQLREIKDLDDIKKEESSLPKHPAKIGPAMSQKSRTFRQTGSTKGRPGRSGSFLSQKDASMWRKVANPSKSTKRGNGSATGHTTIPKLAPPPADNSTRKVKNASQKDDRSSSTTKQNSPDMGPSQRADAAELEIVRQSSLVDDDSAFAESVYSSYIHPDQREQQASRSRSTTPPRVDCSITPFSKSTADYGGTDDALFLPRRHGRLQRIDSGLAMESAKDERRQGNSSKNGSSSDGSGSARHPLHRSDKKYMAQKVSRRVESMSRKKRNEAANARTTTSEMKDRQDSSLGPIKKDVVTEDTPHPWGRAVSALTTASDDNYSEPVTPRSVSLIPQHLDRVPISELSMGSGKRVRRGHSREWDPFAMSNRFNRNPNNGNGYHDRATPSKFLSDRSGGRLVHNGSSAADEVRGGRESPRRNPYQPQQPEAERQQPPAIPRTPSLDESFKQAVPFHPDLPELAVPGNINLSRGRSGSEQSELDGPIIRAPRSKGSRKEESELFDDDDSALKTDAFRNFQGDDDEDSIFSDLKSIPISSRRDEEYSETYSKFSREFSSAYSKSDKSGPSSLLNTHRTSTSSRGPNNSVALSTAGDGAYACMDKWLET